MKDFGFLEFLWACLEAKDVIPARGHVKRLTSFFGNLALQSGIVGQLRTVAASALPYPVIQSVERFLRSCAIYYVSLPDSFFSFCSYILCKND
jgi:hypothetical protein